jgi:hypothetical protein
MTEYKPHELSNIFPLIEGKDFVELKEDIKAHGLREPIVLFEGKILDGRNRFRACQETGVTPVFEEYTGTDPLSFVISLNLKRRHLNESQRAMVGAKLANMPIGAAVGNKYAAKTENKSENFPICPSPARVWVPWFSRSSSFSRHSLPRARVGAVSNFWQKLP